MYRTEHDALGPVDVPAERLWGAQTERSRHFFAIGAPRFVWTRAVIRGLGLLKKSARLAAGRDDVSRAFKAGLVNALVLATDLSKRSRREVTEGRTALPTVTVATQERFGSAIGRKPTGVLALLDGPRAAHVLSDLERLASFVPLRLAHVDEGA